MSEDFVHNLPYPGLPPGRDGMKAVGELVTGAFRDIEVAIDLLLVDGELVADRISAHGLRAETGEPTGWVENHIYRVVDGHIVELWPAGGPSI